MTVNSRSVLMAVPPSPSRLSSRSPAPGRTAQHLGLRPAAHKIMARHTQSNEAARPLSDHPRPVTDLSAVPGA